MCESYTSAKIMPHFLETNSGKNCTKPPVATNFTFIHDYLLFVCLHLLFLMFETSEKIGHINLLIGIDQLDGQSMYTS